MANTTDFISLLIRAATQIEDLGDFGRRKLLETSVATISELSQAAGVSQDYSTKDAMAKFEALSARVALGYAHDAEVRIALLDAARVIRELRVVLDGSSEGKLE